MNSTVTLKKLNKIQENNGKQLNEMKITMHEQNQKFNQKKEKRIKQKTWSWRIKAQNWKSIEKFNRLDHAEKKNENPNGDHLKLASYRNKKRIKKSDGRPHELQGTTKQMNITGIPEDRKKG